MKDNKWMYVVYPIVMVTLTIAAIIWIFGTEFFFLLLLILYLIFSFDD